MTNFSTQFYFLKYMNKIHIKNSFSLPPSHTYTHTYTHTRVRARARTHTQFINSFTRFSTHLRTRFSTVHQCILHQSFFKILFFFLTGTLSRSKTTQNYQTIARRRTHFSDVVHSCKLYMLTSFSYTTNYNVYRTEMSLVSFTLK